MRLSAQQADETPLAFLTRMWGDALPGRADSSAAEVRDALRHGRLCLLVDALNEARRDRYAERMADWREFAAELPAGNHIVFSCRTLDYAGELAVQQVEIARLPLLGGKGVIVAARRSRYDAKFLSACFAPSGIEPLLPQAEYMAAADVVDAMVRIEPEAAGV